MRTLPDMSPAACALTADEAIDSRMARRDDLLLGRRRASDHPSSKRLWRLGAGRCPDAVPGLPDDLLLVRSASLGHARVARKASRDGFVTPEDATTGPC